MTRCTVTFSDKLQFRAKKKLESLHLPCITDNGTITSRGVIFQPRCHKHTTLSERGFVFHEKPKKLCNKDEPVFPTMFTCPPIRENCDINLTTSHRNRAIPTKPVFETRFRPLGTHDTDFVDKAQVSHSFYTWPFINPKPYQHRKIDCTEGLDTRTTPDPFDVKFKTTLITNQLDGDILCATPVMDNTNRESPFVTVKTPDLLFDSRLYFPKGHYSPAFTAHNALLDRIAKSIAQ